MRQRISERNRFPSFELEKEYKKLHDLFFAKGAIGRLNGINHYTPCYSYNDCLNMFFLDWRLRGTFTSVEEMLYSLGISEDDFARGITEERLLDYIQFLINAVIMVSDEVDSEEYKVKKTNRLVQKAILENSSEIAGRLHAEIMGDENEFYLVYKDDIATVVSIQNEDISDSIVDYLKIDNRDDLKRKGEVLCTLAKKLEDYEQLLKGSEFSSLCSDTTMLLNKIGARHSCGEKDTIANKFKAMSNRELSQWYDRAFQMFLSCMVVIPYVREKTKIKRIKAEQI